ncbi:MAG: response regulator, partial [Chloroflexaceae bacterium]|nr:response regulator [Chloroflexaceae bacterium]
MEPDEIKHQLEVADLSKKRLRILERQAALLGINADPAIVIEIEMIKNELAKVHKVAADNGINADVVLLERMLSIKYPIVECQRKVLVIDDQAEITKLTQLYLTGRSYNVITANEGIRGLRLATNEKPDVTLLDIYMPGFSGYDVIQGIRNRRIPTRVIMLTADNQTDTVVHYMKLGASDYITKPFDERRLITTIERSIETDVTIDLAMGEANEKISELIAQIKKIKNIALELVEELECANSGSRQKSRSSVFRLYKRL